MKKGLCLLLCFLVLLSCLSSRNQISNGGEGDELIQATKDGNISGVNEMLSRGVYVDSRDANGLTALMWTAVNGNTDTARLLIARGADLNARGKHGSTALMFAAMKGHTDTVSLLKGAGASQP